ncbi:MAG: hypothetical protein H0V17_29665, partial [Deltaproteobacteria bacterium]|nr:hypothetical protein [Deltaproteobacteria bacterium]
MSFVLIGIFGACTGSSNEDPPIDPIDEPGDSPDDPGVVVGGEHDVLPQPKQLWFTSNHKGSFSASGPLHDVSFVNGSISIGRHHANGTVCASPFNVGTASIAVGRDLRLPNTIHSVGLNQRGELLVARQSFIEKFSNTFFGVEQSWTFPFRPSEPGALTVSVAVTGQDFLGAYPHGLHFAPPGDFGTTYSHGTWIDADGVETTIQAKFQNGHIVLQVPADVVANSKFPAVLDPLIDLNETPVEAALTNAPTGANAVGVSVASSGVDYLAVWRDDRNGGDSDIFGMIVTSAGGPGTANGILIGKTAAGARAPGVQSSPTVAFVNGSYLVVWQDFKSPAGDSDLVAARVSTTGTVTLIGSIASSGAEETRPRIGVRGTEALVAFQSGAGVQAIRYDGTSFVGGPFAIAGTGSQPSVAANPAGNYLVAFTDAATTNLMGQFVTATGTLGGAVSLAAGAGAQELSAASFASPNFVVVWQNNNNGRKLFGARFDADGNVNPLDTHLEATLPANGVQIGTSSSVTQGVDPGLVCGASSCTVTWMDRRNFDLTGNDVFAQRFGFDLTLVGAEIAVSTEIEDQRSPKIAFASATNRLLVLWEDLRNGSPVQITGTRIDAAGNVMDPPLNRVAASVGANSQSNSAVARIPGAGQNWLIAWSDSRGTTGNNIQGVRVSDTLALNALSNTVSNAPGAQGTPWVAATATQHLVVWSDARLGVEDIFASRVTSTGTVLDLNGLQITSAIKEQLRPTAASNGSDRYLVVWQDRRGADFDIFGAVVDAGSGSVLVSDIPIAVVAGEQALPTVAYDSVAGTFVVTWQDGRAGVGQRDIFARIVSTAGVPGNEVTVSAAAGSQLEPRIAFGSNQFLVAWEDRRSGTNIFGSRLRITGGVLAVVDPAGIPISTAAGSQQRPSVGFVTTNEFAPAGTQVGVGAFAVVWDDDRTLSTTGRDIFGTVVFHDSGNVGDEFPVAISTDSERAPAIGTAGPAQANGSLRMLVTYQRQSSTLNAQRVVMRRVTFAAKAINCTTASCNNNCNTGEACDVNCAGAANCTTVCNTSTCFINCEDSTLCSTNCSNGSNCTTDCRGATECHATCAAGSPNNICTIDCSDPSTLNCTDINCNGNGGNSAD